MHGVTTQASLSSTAPALGATASASPQDEAAEARLSPLHGALLESRQRWRDLVTLSADLAFETDAEGNFTFLAPDPVLGWSATALIGQPATTLLADAQDAAMFNPFAPEAPIRKRRAWLRRPCGSVICLAFAAAPLLDATGRPTGARGVAQDVTEQDGYDAAVAAALRRGEVLDHILWRMRQEVLAPRMMQAALDALNTAMGADGCMVVDANDPGVVLHQIATPPAAVLRAVATLLGRNSEEPMQTTAGDGRFVVICPSQTRFGEPAALAIWREPHGRFWDQDELMLAASATGIVRVILEHEAIQREMARQARTDPLTGLLNRRAFMDEMARRIDRLDRENLPGTLMFVDLDNFKDLNDTVGHEAGDEALCLTAALLRATVRPTDLVARLGGDEFALWLDGADDLTAAERAEALRLDAPRLLGEVAGGAGPKLSMSIGIATRWPGHNEELETLLHRADQAMYQVKRSGRGHWFVSRTHTAG
jgi:diguanylate cyclase (GGDEF)-like protein/PAS domain S-box-containing protein